MHRKTMLILTGAVLLSASIAAVSAEYLKVGPVYELKQIYNRNRKCCGIHPFTSLHFAFKEVVGLIKFNSQVGQDRWIVQQVFPAVEKGYFVDVGSADGVLDSNTKVLEELGWKGVCIDPFPKHMTDRTCAMFKEVVDSEAGRKVRFRVAGGLGGIEDHLGAWKNKTAKSETVELTTTSLEAILARAKAPNFIHYVSIDIEGAELAALSAFPFSKYQVGAFTVEHNFEEPKRSQIKTLLESQGYRRERAVKQDDFYVLDPHRPDANLLGRSTK